MEYDSTNIYGFKYQDPPDIHTIFMMAIPLAPYFSLTNGRLFQFIQCKVFLSPVSK